MASPAFAQEAPRIRAGAMAPGLHVDGALDEPMWASAELDRSVHADRSGRRRAGDLTDLGAGHGECDGDRDRHRLRRPGSGRHRQLQRAPRRGLNDEDHVRIVLGPFLDGRSGYVFAVNPSGARYDGLIEPGRRATTPIGTASGRRRRSGPRPAGAPRSGFPIQTLSFNPALREWHFNVQRRIQRRLETDRWAFPARQYQVTQTSRAGVLTDLPEFDLGVGLTVRPAVTDRRRHSRAGAPTSTASSSRASTSRSGSARTCSPR